MKFNFNVDSSFENGIARLSKFLGFELGDGINVKAQCGDKIGVSYSDGEATIYYKEKSHFFRELGLLIQNLREKDSFEIEEDDFFKTIGYMHSTNPGCPNLPAFKEYLDMLSLMGYNMAMLYTEDRLELPNYPYFGHLKGRYTVEEIKELDDYAFDYGIELVPCLECYGHMAEYLIWDAARSIKDTASVLRAREEKTFEFIEELIKTASSAVRSKRIHIGMDEAADMGRGKFMDKNGYVPAMQIFEEYMERLIQITDKYGLKAMMWSDMYIKINSKINSYYDTEVEFPQEVIDKIPNVQLVFWHYGEAPHCDNIMLAKHNQLGKDVIFAGGLWDWYNIFPDHEYCFETMDFSLKACRNNNVREMMVTSWNSGEHTAGLLGLSFSAEKCFNPDVTEEELRKRFEFCTFGNYDAFLTTGQFNNIFNKETTYEDFNERFLGNALFWQDVLEGTFDTHLFEKPMSGHYAACAEKMKGLDGKWKFLYDYAYNVFSFLAIKTKIAENLWPAYQAKDMDTLKHIANDLLPELIAIYDNTYESHVENWEYCCRKLGWAAMDFKWNGFGGRLKTAKRLLDSYLSGKIDKIDSLEAPRLHKGVHPFLSYLQAGTVVSRIL